jgi:7-cyano-7-deazaguanine reductase
MDETGMTRQSQTQRSRPKSLGYNERHAKSGINSDLPEIETWPNQYKGYEITIEIPEYTAICPKTGLADFGTIRLKYMPDKACLELKSLKLYIHAYRNVGIFYENAVNRVLQDIVKASRPVWAIVTGEFTARGGLRSMIEAKYP